MGFNAAIYALSKKYTDNTTDALGGVKGAPATIKSITEIDGGHRITFEWTGTSGTKQTSTLDVMNGVKGAKGDPGTNGSDGTDGIGITSVAKTKTEGLVDTYVITFSDDSTFEYTVTMVKTERMVQVLPQARKMSSNLSRSMVSHRLLRRINQLILLYLL